MPLYVAASLCIPYLPGLVCDERRWTIAHTTILSRSRPTSGPTFLLRCITVINRNTAVAASHTLGDTFVRRSKVLQRPPLALLPPASARKKPTAFPRLSSTTSSTLRCRTSSTILANLNALYVADTWTCGLDESYSLSKMNGWTYAGKGCI